MGFAPNSTWTVIFALALGWAQAAFSDPPSGWIAETRDLGLEILERYPPSQFHYVVVWRNPAPLAAFFQEVGPDLVSTLPLSNMETYPGANSSEFSAQMKRKLFGHFKRHLPASDQLQGRKLLFIDMTTTGKRFQTSMEHLGNYLATHQATTRMEGLALIQGTIHKEKLARELQAQGWATHKLKENLALAMDRSLFHNTSEYGRFDPLKDRTAPSNRVRFLDFSYRRFRQPLEEDPTFLTRLNEVYPANRFADPNYVSRRHGPAAFAKARHCAARFIHLVTPKWH